MAERTTRFAYLLARLGMRSGEIVEKTGIDKSLVSRWKSGQRRIPPHGQQIHKIVDCFLEKENAESVITKTLYAYGLDEKTGTLKENLAFWLCEQEVPAFSIRNPKDDIKEIAGQQYSAGFNIFLGYEGLRNAIVALIDYVTSLPGKRNIVAVVRGNYSWVTLDPVFSELLLSRLNEAFKRGITLTVINRDKFLVEDIAYFSGQWLAAHLAGHIESFYYKEDEADVGEKIIVAVEDSIALRLCNDPAVPDSLYIGMYTDSITVRQIYNVCDEYRQKAEGHFRYDFLANPSDFLEDVQDDTLASSSVYTVTQIPTFGTIPIEDAHVYAHSSQRDTAVHTQQLKALFNLPTDAADAGFVRHIFCTELIEEVFEGKRHKNAALSNVYGKHIFHSKDKLLQQLKNIRQWLYECKNYEAVFLPKRIFDSISMEYIGVKDQFMAAWLKDGSQSTCVREAIKTEALFGYAEILWEQAPKMYKNKQRSLRQLNEWIGEDR